MYEVRYRICRYGELLEEGAWTVDDMNGAEMWISQMKQMWPEIEIVDIAYAVEP